MNKREALELCEKGWLELAETGGGYTAKKVLFKGLISSCPCCEFAFALSEMLEAAPCPLCPIPPYRWSLEAGCCAPCADGSSPYAAWSGADAPKERKLYAAQIAALARGELDKMDES